MTWLSLCYLWVVCCRRRAAIFGRPLADTLVVERARERGRKVPELVQMCVEFLLRHGLTSEGIFRSVRNEYGVENSHVSFLGALFYT